MNIPIILLDTRSAGKAGTSAAYRPTDRAISSMIRVLRLEDDAVNQCVDAASQLVEQMSAAMLHHGAVELQSVTVNFGVTADGHIGILGSGVGGHVAAGFQLVIKPTKPHDAIGKPG